MKGTVIFQVDKAFRKPHMQWCTATFSTSNAFQDLAESGMLSKTGISLALGRWSVAT